MRYPPLLLSVALLAPASYADIQFNGFLSAVGGVATDEPIRGYEKDATFKNDTLFGLQASADISDKLSMTGQLVSRGENDYATDLSWGYIAYEVTSSFRVRMGKFRTPFYFSSDFLEVGYAYPGIAPSDEVYSVQFDNIEGIDLFYNTSLFDTVNLDVQAYYGSVSTDFVLGDTGQAIDTETRNHVGLVTTFGLGDFALRLSAHNATLSVKNFLDIAIPALKGATMNEFFDAAIAATQGQGFDDIVAGIRTEISDIEETRATFVSAGLKYDGEYVFGVVEGTNLTYDKGPSAEQRRYLATAGVNIGSASIFTTFSRADDVYVDLAKPINLTLTPQFAEQAAVLDGISELLGVTSDTITFGIRYDFEPGAALKIQYDSVSTPDPANPNDDITNGLLRFGVDLVF
ncbi:hypothetical protein [Marinagarivorans algicola]|uniref:hypothetical protein n=1 Tax=Marinagarivorans algicola TaxID=1513270 RepID=UPI0006B50FEE|nr:hypothetical protein [Marinagarivorans algicola]